MPVGLIAVIALALTFDLLNGIRDSSNIVATMISSRSFSTRTALAITAAAEFAGPLIFGVAVARTIAGDLVEKGSINLEILVAALGTAILWNLLTGVLGIPSSSSHALFGGLIGAVATGVGWQAIHMAGIIKVLIALFTSPLIGLVFGYLITRLTLFLCWDASPRINWFFKRAQILTAVGLALSYGANDAQKSMGIITLGLVTAGYLEVFQVPTWVIFACVSMIALGTLLSGKKLIRTLGTKFYKIRPVDSFNTQLSSAIVILSASLLGGPVSTTQVVSTAIMGVGAAERMNKVRWGVAGEIATAWLLTIPSTALVGAGLYWAISHVR